MEKIRTVDETYWTDYKTTPKAFVSLRLAKKLWHTRWGTISCLRLPSDDGLTADAVASRLRLEPRALGFYFRPVKRVGLAAAAGTTPFEALFLGFSFFLMVAALLLVALLFQLGVASRSGEIGLFTSLGFPRRRIQRLLLTEGCLVAAVGAACGTLGGATNVSVVSAFTSVSSVSASVFCSSISLSVSSSTFASAGSSPSFCGLCSSMSRLGVVDTTLPSPSSPQLGQAIE